MAGPTLNTNAIAAAYLGQLARQQEAVAARGFGPRGGIPAPGAGLGGFAQPQPVYDWVSGAQTWTAASLPRTADAFLSGQFGPSVPPVPLPLDPEDAEGRRAPARRWQYPVAWNRPSGLPGSEGLKLVPFAQLRLYADFYSVCRSCLNVREDEVLGIDWEIVPTKEAEKAMQGDPDAQGNFQQRVKEATSFFERPDPQNYVGYHDWLRALLEDCFVNDAVALTPQPPRVRGRGVLGSDVAALVLLDGSSIKPLVDVSGALPRVPNVAYQQYLWGVPRRDLMQILMEDEDALAEYGERVDDFSTDEIFYLRYQPRTWTPYGLGLVEQAILPIVTGIKVQLNKLAFFSEGSIPDTYLTGGPEISTITQAQQWQESLNAIAGDTGYKHKIVVLPNGAFPHPMKPSQNVPGLLTEDAEWTCMVMAVMPSELGLTPSKSAGLGGKGLSEGQENTTFRRGLLPFLAWLKRVLFDPVLQMKLRQSDMEWRWIGIEPQEDQSAKEKDALARVHGGVDAVDEMRILLGKQPWGLPETSTPHYFTPGGLVALDGTQPPPPPLDSRPADPADSAAPGAPEQPPEAPPEGGAAPTPLHAAQQAAEAPEQAAAEKTADESAAVTKTAVALRELDQWERRLSKGRGRDRAFVASAVDPVLAARIAAAVADPPAEAEPAAWRRVVFAQARRLVRDGGA